VIKKTTLLAAAVILVSCASEYIQAPLPMPPRPNMPVFTDAELECLPDDVYRRIAMRDMEKEFYIERLELIIKSTWK
jgi:hypothetical protein